MHARSIDSDAFIQFVLTVLENSKPTDFVLFLYNCRMHHSNKGTKFLLKNGIKTIFNIAFATTTTPLVAYGPC